MTEREAWIELAIKDLEWLGRHARELAAITEGVSHAAFLASGDLIEEVKLKSCDSNAVTISEYRAEIVEQFPPLAVPLLRSAAGEWLLFASPNAAENAWRAAAVDAPRLVRESAVAIAELTRDLDGMRGSSHPAAR